MQSRFNAARETLAKHQTVDPGRIGAVGYCFGGAVVLNMARAGADLAGVATFHGSLGANVPAPAPGAVKAKVLVLNGADDPFVKPEAIDGSEARDVAVKVVGRELTFKGQPYLLQFVMPNFYFHATTAYAILRHNGVELGKRDFMGNVPGLTV